MNEYELIALFCRIDDFCKGRIDTQDPRQEMATSEVVTAAVLACRMFSGKYRLACQYLKQHRYCPKMLSESRFNRRLHALLPGFWEDLMRMFSIAEPCSEYIVDSFPVATCRSARHLRVKMFQGEEFRGYNSSQKTWFFGLKVHLVATITGMPVSMIISPGSVHDLTALKVMDLPLPKGSDLYGDKAYTDYEWEIKLQESAQIHLVPQRKCNTTKPHPEETERRRSKTRKLIETAISGIVRLMPRWIQAVTEEGFELKLTLFVIASATFQLAS